MLDLLSAFFIVGGVCFFAAVAGLFISGLNIQKQFTYVLLRRDKVFREKLIDFMLKVCF